MRPQTVIVALLATVPFLLPAHAASPEAGPAQETTERPAVGEIMAKAMGRAKAQDEQGAELWFESLVLTTAQRIDADSEVSETETSLHKRYPLDGLVYEELVERDGEPLEEDEAQEEQERKAAFRAKAEAATAKGETVETNDERQMRFDGELMSRYQAELVGEETLRGEMCWLVDFEPRDGPLPENTRMDKALNKSTGRLYVSQQDYGIMRIEFELQEPIRFLWGLVASLTQARGVLDFTRVESSVWLPDAFDLRFDIRVFFRTMRRHVVREWVKRTKTTSP